MGTRKLVTGSIGTVLVGVFLGFVLSAFAGVIIQDSGLLGTNGESPVARAYMLGLLEQKPETIVGIRPNQSIAQRAAELQGAETSRSSSSIQPLSLTYMGGATVGSYAVHIYAVGLRSSSGTDQFFPLALTISGGKVVRSE